MHLAFLHSDIRLFSSKHSLTSVDRCDMTEKEGWIKMFSLCYSLGCMRVCSPTNAGHAGQVQRISIKAVTRVTLLNPDTPTVLTAVQYSALLCSQTLKSSVWI